MLKIRLNKKKIITFPDLIISNELKDLFLSIIDLNKFSENEYNNLTDSDKKIFDDILTKANIEHGSMLYKHKKYNHQDINDTITQYNILKGEILAGNSNYDLLINLKKVIIKLMNYNILDKSTVNELMTQILYSL